MARFAVLDVQRDAALGAAESVLQAVAEEVVPAERVGRLFGMSASSGAGRDAHAAWVHLVRAQVATRATITQALLSGHVKATFRAWLMSANGREPCVAATLRRFDDLPWDEDALSRFGGYGVEAPRSVASARRFVVTRYGGSTRPGSPVSDFVERSVGASEHAALVRLGTVATLPRVLGLRLRVFRHHDRLAPGTLADNQSAVYLMADPHSGLAARPWTEPGVGGLGPVDVVAEDGDHGVVDAALLMDYLDDLMDRWGAGRPTARLSPDAFRRFVDERAARVKRGQAVAMVSGEAAMISFTHSSQLHLCGRSTDRVVLVGLSTPGYNRAHAVLGPYDADTGRFQVFLAAAQDPYRAVLIKPENLVFLNADGAPTPPRPVESACP